MGSVYGSIVVRGRFVVVAAWAVAVFFALQQPHVDLKRNGAGVRDLAPVDLPAVQAELRAAEAFPVPLHSRTLLVEREPSRLTPSQLQAIGARSAGRQAIAGAPDFLGAVPLLNTGFPLASDDPVGTTVVSYLIFSPSAGETARNRQAHRLKEAATERVVDVRVTGATPARLAAADEILDSLPRLELVTAIGISLIVGAFYRSLLAPIVVLAAIGVAYTMSQLVIAQLARFANEPIPSEVEPVLVALILGAVTDYSLFFLSGTRRALRAGSAPLDAVRQSAGINGRIVTTAALTVCAGTGALALADTDFLAAFGPTLAAAVAASLVVSVTLVPALLAILGRFAFFPSRLSTASSKRRRPLIARVVASRRRSVVTSVVIAVVLIACTLPTLSLRLGYDAVDGLPATSEPAAGQRLLERAFPAGVLAPSVVLVEGSDLPEHLPDLERMQQRIARQDGVAGVLGPGTLAAARRLAPRADGDTVDLARALGLVISDDGRSARLVIFLSEDPYGGRAVRDLRNLRDQIDAPAGTRVSLGGDTAVVSELLDILVNDMQRIIVAILIFDLLLLMAFLRSAVVAVLILAGSLLALGAALGLTTVAYQMVLGQDGVTFYVPLATLVLLLSLGADYGIFAAGHVRDRQLAGQGTTDAIIDASEETNATIAVAGLVLALSFALLALVQIQAFQQFAFAMATGVLIDTFVIRPIFLPAMIRALDSRGALPSRLRRAASP